MLFSINEVVWYPINIFTSICTILSRSSKILITYVVNKLCPSFSKDLLYILHAFLTGYGPAGYALFVAVYAGLEVSVGHYYLLHFFIAIFIGE